MGEGADRVRGPAGSLDHGRGYYFFFQTSVPLVPASVRRQYLPSSEPSGLTSMIMTTTRFSALVATASELPIIWPMPTYLPPSHLSSSAPFLSIVITNGPGPSYFLPSVSVPVTV